MSTLGLTIKSQIESGAWRQKTLAVQASNLTSLITSLDDADLSNDIPQAIYEFYGLGPSKISEDFAKVAINLQFNGVNIGDSVSQDQLRRLFLNPVEDEQNLGAKARDRLVFRAIINDLNGAGLTNERIFQDNISDTEAVVQGSVQDTLANYWSYTTGQAEVHSKNASVIAKTIAEILGDIPVPPPSASAQAVEQISDAEAKQCVLLNLLGPLNDFYDEAINYNATVNQIPKFPYEGKIIKFVCDPPNHFVNNLTAVPNINDYFTSLPQSTYSYLAKPSVDVRLSFIRSEGNALLDLPIIDVSENVEVSPSTAAPAAAASANSTPSPFDNAVTIKVEAGETTKTAKIQAAQPKAAGDSITTKGPQWLTDSMKFEFDISYQGTNPSTSRNDVDVTITFQSSNLSDFIENWNYSKIPSIKDINFNLFDLVLFPLYTKDTDGYGKNFRSQYSPNYNRIRLAYRARAPNIPDGNKIPTKHPDIVEWYKQNSNVLDLTVVDHEFTRDDKYDFYTLKITYKGYVQSMLTSPETDALSNSATKDRRAGRDLLVQEALAKGCSQTEIAKIISSINAASANDVSDVSNDFIKEISSRKNVNGLGLFTLDFATIKTDLKDNKVLKLEDIKKQIASYSPIINTPTSTTSLGTSIGPVSNVDKILNKNDNIYFFYLADILDVVLNHSDMYTTVAGTGDLASATRIKQELRFILGSFVYLDENGKTYNINIGHVPISVDYFKEWYKETIMDKELFLYPCLSFIRDLFEKVVTNLLNEVCFKTSEEQKVLVRTSFFTGTKNQASQFSPSNDKVLNFYWNGLNTTPPSSTANSNSTKTVSYIDSAYVNEFPLIKNEFGKDVNEYINYCVLYVQGAQQVGRTAPTTVVPEFKVNNSRVLGESDFSFSRNSQTGLREARYFRNSTTGITMLASVYNTDLTLEVPMCFLYPGHFYKLQLYTGDNTRAKLNLGTGGNNYLFEELGLDGYYAITKVSHKIFGNIQNLQFDNKISGLWVSSDNPYHSVRFQNLPESQKITDPTELTKQEDCNILVDLGNEISLKSLSKPAQAVISQTIIDDRLAISNRPTADQELTGVAALRGLGDATERTTLISNAFTHGTTGTLTKLDGTKLNYTINYDAANNQSSVIDDTTKNIIGVFQTDNTNTIFIENPSYFSQGVEE